MMHGGSWAVFSVQEAIFFKSSESPLSVNESIEVLEQFLLNDAYF
jgi:hypothetical protein